MPGGFPLGLDVCNPQSIGLTTQTTGAQYVPQVFVPFAGTINTKGSWTQLIASTSAEIVFVFVTLVNNAVGTGCVDIGIGAGGSEVVVVSNLELSEQMHNDAPQMFAFPLSIPSGARVAARSQSSTSTTSSAGVSIVGYDGAFTQLEGCAGVDAMGFSTTTSMGTAVTPSAGAKGSYSQLIASTLRDYIGIFLVFDSQNGTTPNFSQQDIDVAIGGAGSEQIIINDITFLLENGGGILGAAPDHTPFFPINIPAGTRLAVRASASSGTFAFGVSAYGVYQ